MIIDAENEDFLQDISFDYYGTRMAVCGSDRKIKIFEKNFRQEWEMVSIWEAHDAPVWKVRWANPEFGIILASCGFDKRVNIWQEKRDDNKSKWVSRAKIQDFSDSVEDISFCPKTYGLKLAATTLNGKMKIFELADYANNMIWNCISQKDVSSVGCSSVCWNPSIIDPQTLVVGCLYDQKKDNKSDLIQIFAYSDQKKEYTFIISLKDNGHTDSVTDCQWAPVFGRSYHLIASCSLDKSVKIWKVELNYNNIANSEGYDNIQINYSLMFNHEHDKPFWRVSWNLAGSILTVIDEVGRTILLSKVDEDSFEIIPNKV